MQKQNKHEITFEEIIKQFSPWSNPKNSVYPLNRYTLRRNISGFPFGEKLLPADAKILTDKLVKALFVQFPNGYFFSSEELTDKNFHLLFEHLFLSNREALPKNSGLFIDLESLTIALIHLEDHLTLFFHDSNRNGEDIEKQISKVEQSLEGNIPFAYQEEFGYITASALNLGTGLTKEAIIHAPAINFLNEQLQENDKVMAHGLGSDKDVLHNLVIFSNKYTLGMSEKNIIRCVDEVSNLCQEKEISARDQLKKDLSKKLENIISKDYGSILFCNSLEFHESLRLASSIDLGVALGLFSTQESTLYFDLFFSLRRAHLEAYFSDSSAPIEEKRAQLFKEKIKDFKPTFC